MNLSLLQIFQHIQWIHVLTEIMFKTKRLLIFFLRGWRDIGDMKVFLLMRLYLKGSAFFRPLPQTRSSLSSSPLLAASFAQTESFFGHLLLWLKEQVAK